MEIEEIRFARDERRAVGSATRLESGSRSGSLVRVRRGAYVDNADWSGLPAAERHRLTALAFLRSANGAVVFSRETAAVLLGIPILGLLPDRPVIAVTPRTTCTDAGAIRRAIALGDDEIVRVGGVLVTSPLRTAIDVGAHGGPDAAVVALSDVRRRWGVDPADVERHLLRRRPFRGIRSIDAALPAVSALSETPIESLGMLRFHQLGFELPVQQVQRRVNGRTYRDDYEWPAAGVIGEADGRVKYADPRALWDEKVCEDDLRSICRAFVRVYWSDLHDDAALRAKLVRAGVPRTHPRRARPDAPTQAD